MNNFFPAVFGDNLFDIFDVFDRGVFPFFGGNPEQAGGRAKSLMKTDVRETDGGYSADIDLPGFGKDDIRLNLENGYLTVAAEKTVEKNEDGEGRLLRRERYTGAMRRSFYVGRNITEEDVRASFKDGVLHLDLPKKENRPVPERKPIMIEG